MPAADQVAGPSRAGEAGPLGTTGDRTTPPPLGEALKRQDRRDGRHRLKAAQRRLTASSSSRYCWHAIGQNVTVDVGYQCTAHVSGIQRCGSPWCCPICSPVIRERRAREIDEGLGRHLAAGGGAVFVTLTAPHQLRDGLAPRLALMGEALRHLLNGAPWRRRAARLGYIGMIRAVEVTWGEVNGWHAHLHAVLLLDRPATADEVADLDRWALGRWAAVVERKGFGRINGHGVDVRPVVDAGDLGGYLTKVEGGWGVGLELARSDLKVGRRPGSLNPVGILRSFVETGEVRMLDLWREFEAATFGKRAIVWSPGLKARLGVVQVEDEEAAAAEGADVARLRWLIARATWLGHLRGGTTGELLTGIEWDALRQFAVAAAAGVEIPPLDDKEVPP